MNRKAVKFSFGLISILSLLIVTLYVPSQTDIVIYIDYQ